jgi:hypothetical protein
MALLNDAMQTPEETPIIQKYAPEPLCTPDGLILNHDYHMHTGRLEYRVHCSNQLQEKVASYADLQGLNCLVKYEDQMTNLHKVLYGQSGYRSLQQMTCRATIKYTLQRDKEAAALRDNMDSDEDKLGQESKLALKGSSLAPSIDSPQASSGGWLRMLAEASSSEGDAHSSFKEKVPCWTLEEELPLDLAGTMITKQPSLASTDWERNGY